MFKLLFTEQACKDLEKLKQDRGLIKRLNSVRKALAYLETNPKHQSLSTHKYNAFHNINDGNIFEAYAENNTPAAYRIFWHYGPNKDNITIIAITSHP
jgi:hypothetical protein